MLSYFVLLVSYPGPFAASTLNVAKEVLIEDGIIMKTGQIHCLLYKLMLLVGIYGMRCMFMLCFALQNGYI